MKLYISKISSFSCKKDASKQMIKKVFGDRQVKFTDKGKPYIENEKHFNISHSEDLIILALDDNEIGADVERIRAFNEKIVSRCFTAEEQKYFEKEKTPLAFFKIWTGKEAVMKGEGVGLSMGANTFSVYPENTTGWNLTWLEYEQYIICLAAKTPTPLKIIEM